MMARVRLITAEAVRSLGANLSTTFAATTTVLIGMFMLGLVVGLGSWALSLSDHYKKQLLVKVYFCTDLRCGHEATGRQIDEVHARLASIPQVKSVRFIDKATALRIETKKHPEMTKNLPGNPLPNEYEVIPKNGAQVDTIAAQLTGLNQSAGVEKICPPPPGSKEAATATGESCNRITVKNADGSLKTREFFTGGGPSQPFRITGSVTAIDAATGKIVAKQETRFPNLGGIMATPDLVFSGQPSGEVQAFDAKTLEKLWEFNTGGGVSAPPITFSVDGKQYIAVLVGMGGAWDKWFIDATPELKKMQPGSTLYVFSL